MPLIEKRYAEALLDVAVQENEIDAYRQELQTVVAAFEENKDFRLLLLNPCAGSEMKKDIVGRIFTNSVRKEVSSLMLLLLDKRRIKCLPGILKEYVKLADRKTRMLGIRIVSAVPLENDQLHEICEKFRKKYNASFVRGELSIDAQLIGGVKVIVGDKLTDGTVKGRLNDLRESLQRV